MPSVSAASAPPPLMFLREFNLAGVLQSSAGADSVAGWGSPTSCSRSTSRGLHQQETQSESHLGLACMRWQGSSQGSSLLSLAAPVCTEPGTGRAGMECLLWTAQRRAPGARAVVKTMSARFQAVSHTLVHAHTTAPSRPPSTPNTCTPSVSGGPGAAGPSRVSRSQAGAGGAPAAGAPPRSASQRRCWGRP